MDEHFNPIRESVLPFVKSNETELNDGRVQWTEDQETVLTNISHNAGLMSEHHKTQYIKLIKSLQYYKIPIICLSGLNSVISIGGNSYIDQNIVSTITCLISLLVSCISSIELYLSIQKKSDQEVISYKQFYTLAVKINTTLMLDRINRQGDGDTFLTQVLQEYNSLFDSSCVNGLQEQDKLVDLSL